MADHILALTHAFRACFRTLACVTCAAFVLGCNSAGPPLPSPTSPTSTAPAVALTYTITGTVTTSFAQGAIPLSGVIVEESASHQIARSIADGTYSMHGLPAGATTLRATMSGFEPLLQRVVVTGDMTVDLQLAALPSFILSGIVFEMTSSGPLPLEGVDLYCDSCGSPVGHTRVTSDAQGFYSFAWSRNGLHPLLVTKAGFDVAPAIAVKRDALTFVNVIVNGDTRYDVELVRR